MASISVYQARAELSRLIERALAGEEIVIAKAGKPMARLVPIEPRRPRKSGFLKGKIWIADDFNAPLPDDILDAFEAT